MNNILFIADYRPSDKLIYRYALKLSQYFNAVIHPLHVYDSLMPPKKIFKIKPIDPNHQKSPKEGSRKKEEKKRLNDFVQMFTPKQSHDLIGDVLIRSGRQAEEILKVLKSQRFDLIVMGMNQQSKLKDVMFGNLSLQMIDTATCPLFLIPQMTEYHGLNNIIFITDFSIVDQDRIQWLLEWSLAFRAKLTVVNFSRDNEKRNRAQYLEDWMEVYFSAFKSKQIEFVLIEDCSFANIKKTIEDLDGDLVCLPRHNRKFWPDILDPHMTKNLAKRIQTPLLILPKL